MLNFSITHIGIYRKAEKFIQTVSCPWITFYVGGCKYLKVHLPDGKLLREENSGTGAYLGIRLPGMKIDFEMGKKRENWVIMLKDMPLAYSQNKLNAEFMNGTESIFLPFFVNVPFERVAGWQMELKRIQEAYLNPTPKNSLRARLGVMNILRFMIDETADTLAYSPVEKLKNLIDEDRNFSRSILELSKSCSCSADHLRGLFQERYQINPLAYRNQRRKAFIMELIANSNLSVKEIAVRSGFKYLSHFCLAFQKEYCISPKEGIRRFRHLAGKNK
ncbi:MAG: hypothetical protein A2017_20275 [Lentisphaerae bacterium GWF2_44_16]|nr:MAG: hypothetical protein A2017_20275 [Lentisphaerae bacterium GWF2_44_16]